MGARAPAALRAAPSTATAPCADPMPANATCRKSVTAVRPPVLRTYSSRRRPRAAIRAIRTAATPMPATAAVHAIQTTRSPALRAAIRAIPTAMILTPAMDRAAATSTTSRSPRSAVRRAWASSVTRRSSATVWAAVRPMESRRTERCAVPMPATVTSRRSATGRAVPARPMGSSPRRRHAATRAIRIVPTPIPAMGPGRVWLTTSLP